MTVKRWSSHFRDNQWHIAESETGSYILASDYDALIAKLKALEKRWDRRYAGIRGLPFSGELRNIIKKEQP